MVGVGSEEGKGGKGRRNVSSWTPPPFELGRRVQGEAKRVSNLDGEEFRYLEIASRAGEISEEGREVRRTEREGRRGGR